MSKATVLPLLLAALGGMTLPACQNTPTNSTGHTHSHAHHSNSEKSSTVLLAVPAKTDDAEAEENFTIAVAQGGTAEITLPFQAGTGYSWALAAHSDGLSLVNTSTRSLTDDGRTGGPMEVIYVLKRSSDSDHPDTATFKLSRPWEDNAPPAREVKVTFKSSEN
ncbi:MAG: hypothetical protein CBC35_03775 [Planctomycetes bacterium TMED75]|nr:hypothetical protein [Planctomycetaceae bacterium]OUU94608.1 MAG: hypothetical protein CBC35_03775 [Planctomycetes bacterium TMED75]